MPKRICWKKGMRLTDEVLRAADKCTDQAVNQAILLATAGRFGLFPAARPFQLSLSITHGYVEVESLTCLALTRGGDVIDVQLSGDSAQTMETRIPFPEDESDDLLLTINVNLLDWEETADGYIEPRYYFSLIGSKTALSVHSMPIAHLVYDDEVWNEDKSRFLPPCLYLASHYKYDELCNQLIDVLRSIDEKTKHQLDTPVRAAIGIYWPIVQQTLISVNTERESMTPAQLQAHVQRVVGGFALACDFDEVLNLEDAATFYNFSQAPYNAAKAYLRIRQGIGMCSAINDKIEKFSLLRVTPPPKPEPIPEPKPQPKPEPRKGWFGKQI